jgi:hypothetical protein
MYKSESSGDQRSNFYLLKTDLNNFANRVTLWACGAIVFTAALTFIIGRYVH